jgi:hypothetical protein
MTRSRRLSHKKVSKKVSKRVGNKLKIVSRGKTKTFKVKKNCDGREYYVSGKRKTKHYLSKKRRHFGNSKGSLIDIMGNFRPEAEMSFAQSTTGMSAPQMLNHMGDVPLNLRANNYTNGA